MPSKKGKRSSPSSSPTDKEGTKPWPDIPKQLLSIIERQSIMNNFSYEVVTKSWKVQSPKQCKPSGKLPLLPQLTAIDIEHRSHVSSKSAGPKHPRQYYKKYGSYYFKGYSQGVLVGTKDDVPFHYPLWAPIITMRYYLKSWDNDVPFKYVALSSPPFGKINPVTMVVTGMSKPAFVFKRSRTSKWVKHDCTLSDPYSSNNQLMQFTNIISFQGKFYALSLQGTLAVVEASDDSDPRITGFGKSRAVPGVFSKHFKEYLLQSNGELLLVFLISRKSIKVVDYIEVYRLEFDRLTWVKLEELGDRTLFRGTKCCISMTSSRVGCRSNCVYFSPEEEKEGGGCGYLTCTHKQSHLNKIGVILKGNLYVLPM